MLMETKKMRLTSDVDTRNTATTYAKCFPQTFLSPAKSQAFHAGARPAWSLTRCLVDVLRVGISKAMYEQLAHWMQFRKNTLCLSKYILPGMYAGSTPVVCLVDNSIIELEE